VAPRTGQRCEWTVNLLGDGVSPLPLNNLFAAAPVWTDCPLPDGTVVDLYLLERRWNVALSFGIDNTQPAPGAAPQLNWPASTRSLTREGPEPLFRSLRVQRCPPLYVATRAPAIRRVVLAPGSAPADPAPQHGQDFTAAGFEFGTLVNYSGQELTAIRVAKADATVAGTVTYAVWLQSSSGLWVLDRTGAIAAAAASATELIQGSGLYRRIYVQLTGGTFVGGVLYTELAPYVLPGHDFTGDSVFAARIADPYVRLRFGAVVVAPREVE